MKPRHAERSDPSETVNRLDAQRRMCAIPHLSTLHIVMGTGNQIAGVSMVDRRFAGQARVERSATRRISAIFLATPPLTDHAVVFSKQQSR
jgi:hypothetical protein